MYLFKPKTKKYTFMIQNLETATREITHPHKVAIYPATNLQFVIIMPTDKDQYDFINAFAEVSLKNKAQVDIFNSDTDFTEIYQRLEEFNDKPYILFADLDFISQFNRKFSEQTAHEKIENINTSNKKDPPLLISYTKENSLQSASALLFNHRLGILLASLTNFKETNTTKIFNAILTNGNTITRILSQNNVFSANELFNIILKMYPLIVTKVRSGLYEIEKTVSSMIGYRYQALNVKQQFSTALGKNVTVLAESVRKDSQLVPLSSTNFMLINIYRSSTPNAKTILYIPGDGFVRSISMDDIIAANLASKTNCNVVMLNPRLAPEYSFPFPLHDTLNAIIFILVNYRKLNLNIEDMAGFGYSSGSTLWLQLLGIIDSSKLNISKLYLFSPQVAFGKEFPPQEDFNAEPHFGQGVIKSLANDYSSQVKNRQLLDDPRFSPLSAKEKSISPNTIIFTTEGDYNRPSLIRFCENRNATLHTVEANGGHLALWSDERVLKYIASHIIKTNIVNAETEILVSKL